MLMHIVNIGEYIHLIAQQRAITVPERFVERKPCQPTQRIFMIRIGPDMPRVNRFHHHGGSDRHYIFAFGDILQQRLLQSRPHIAVITRRLTFRVGLITVPTAQYHHRHTDTPPAFESRCLRQQHEIGHEQRQQHAYEYAVLQEPVQTHMDDQCQHKQRIGDQEHIFESVAGG